MQRTYQVKCKCGHDFPIPARFLSTDEQERDALIKALEGLLCPDCIQAAIDQVHALREHLLRTKAVSPDITEVGWRTLARSHLAFPGEPYPPITQQEHTILAQIDRWNRHHPVGTEVFIIPLGKEHPPGLLGSKTTSPARMHHGRAVVDVKGHGMINLDRLIDMTSTNECMQQP